jgi:hypothetical protein
VSIRRGVVWCGVSEFVNCSVAASCVAVCDVLGVSCEYNVWCGVSECVNCSVAAICVAVCAVLGASCECDVWYV